jgi:peptide/nickel transport system substrate-binding protein
VNSSTKADSQATTLPGNAAPKQGDPIDPALTLAQWAVPSDSQYNPWNGKNYAEPRRMLFDRLMMYNLAKQEYLPYALSDWTVDTTDSGTTVSLSIRDGMTWHNGDPVAAEDLVTQLKLDMYTGNSLGDYVDDISTAVKKTGKKTVELSMAPVNDRVVLSLIQPTRLVAYKETFGEYLTAFEEAGSDKERDRAYAELTKLTIPKPIGNGPFQFDSADAQRTLLTKFEDHPDADRINYPKAEYLYMPTNQKRWNALINNRTDGSATLFMPRNKLNQLDSSVRVARIPRHWGMGLIFNHAKKPFDDPKVRKAFAYVIDRKSVAKNSGAGTNTKVAVDIPCGLTGNFSGKVTGKWLSPDTDGAPDQFQRYETNAEKAATLLREAGYEKKNGAWVDAQSGEPLKAPLKCPAGFSDWVAGARTIVSQLDSFGVEAQLLTKDTATYWGKDYANGDFVLGLNGWASYSHVYPYFHYQWLWTSSDSEDIWQVPETVTVPPYSNPSGAPTETKPDDLVNKLSRATDAEAQQLIERLAWITNQTLPVLPIQEKLAQSFMTADHWNVPPADSPKVMEYWPTEWLPRQGWWTAKTKGGQ